MLQYSHYFLQSDKCCRMMLKYYVGIYCFSQGNGLHKLNPTSFTRGKLIGSNGEEDGINTFMSDFREGYEKNMILDHTY